MSAKKIKLDAGEEEAIPPIRWMWLLSIDFVDDDFNHNHSAADPMYYLCQTRDRCNQLLSEYVLDRLVEYLECHSRSYRFEKEYIDRFVMIDSEGTTWKLKENIPQLDEDDIVKIHQVVSEGSNVDHTWWYAILKLPVRETLDDSHK